MGGGACDVDCVNAFLTGVLSRVVRTAGPIPAVAVGGFVAGDVGPL